MGAKCWRDVYVNVARCIWVVSGGIYVFILNVNGWKGAKCLTVGALVFVSCIWAVSGGIPCSKFNHKGWNVDG